MTDREPRYRFRGSVKPSAEVARPVAAYRNTANANANGDGDKPNAGTSATLDIFDVIDSYGGWWGISAGDVDAALKQIGEVETLYVRLNSPGGEATEGVAIANLLRAHPASVRVTVYGMAASAASYIAIAGDTVNMGPGSLMFVHDAINIIYGDAADLRKEADSLDVISDSIAGLYVLKAGGDTAQWRAAMHADTWYSAEAAVTAKLADAVGLDPQMPDNLPPVEDDDATDDATVIEIDVNLSPAARAAARRFDLSMLPNAPAALAPKTPAEPQETPPTENKEADDMSDTLSKGLRERLGVTDETLDEAGLLAALDETLAEHAETAPAASANDGELAVLRRELQTTQSQLRDLSEARARDESAAKAGEKARIFAVALARGVVHPADHPERVQDEADYDAAPEVMARVLTGRTDGSRIPVTTAGYTSDPAAAKTDPAAGDDYWFPGRPTPAAATATKER